MRRPDEDEEETLEQLLLRALTVCKNYSTITPNQLERRVGIDRKKAKVVYSELRKTGAISEEEWKNNINVGIIDKKRLKVVTSELIKNEP